MVELIYIEPDEEISSIVEKLREAKASSLRLVAPRGAMAIQSMVNLKLVKKEAQTLKKHLSITTPDEIGQKIARQVGFEVYEKPRSKTPVGAAIADEAKKTSHDRGRETEPSPTKPAGQKLTITHFQEPSEGVGAQPALVTDRLTVVEHEPPTEAEEAAVESADQFQPMKIARSKRRMIFLVLAIFFVALVAAGLALLLPQATVTLTLVGEPFEHQAVVEVKTERQGSDKNQAVITGRLLDATQSLTERFQSSGKKNVGEKSKGSVTVFNAWSAEPQPLSEGTKLVKDGKDFLTKSSVTIPGATVTLQQGQTITTPGQVNVMIEATEPGEAFNVSAGRLTIPDNDKTKQSKIYAESASALTGGTTREVLVVTRLDIEQAHSSLEQKIKEALIGEIKSKAADQILLDGAVQLEVIEGAANKQENTESADFDYTLKAKLTGLVFNQNDFRKMFVLLTNQSIKEDKQLILTDTDQIIARVEEFDRSNNTLRVSGRIKAQIAPKVDQPRLAQAIKNQAVDRAEAIVKDKVKASSVSITLSPAWYPRRLPFLASKIKFSIEQTPPPK